MNCVHSKKNYGFCNISIYYLAHIRKTFSTKHISGYMITCCLLLSFSLGNIFPTPADKRNSIFVSLSRFEVKLKLTIVQYDCLENKCMLLTLWSIDVSFDKPWYFIKNNKYSNHDMNSMILSEFEKCVCLIE